MRLTDLQDAASIETRYFKRMPFKACNAWRRACVGEVKLRDALSLIQVVQQKKSKVHRAVFAKGFPLRGLAQINCERVVAEIDIRPGISSGDVRYKGDNSRPLEGLHLERETRPVHEAEVGSRTAT